MKFCTSSMKDGIELYARWKKDVPGIRKEYEKISSMPLIEKIFSIVIKNIKWFFRERFSGRDKR